MKSLHIMEFDLNKLFKFKCRLCVYCVLISKIKDGGQKKLQIFFLPFVYNYVFSIKTKKI